MAGSGDHVVTFLVGPEETRLQADARIMRRHSSVFEKILGPNFMEANQKEIKLPKDPDAAFRAVLDILHGRIFRLSKGDRSASKLVRDIAVLYDKYDITVLENHLQHLIKTTAGHNSAGFLYLAEAAFIIRHEMEFRRQTSKLILDHEGSYIPLMGQVSPHVPPETFLVLEERRTQIRERVWSAWMELVTFRDQYCGAPCAFHEQLSAELRNGLWRYQLGPLYTRKQRLNDTLSGLQKLVEASVSLLVNSSVSCNSASHQPGMDTSHAVMEGVNLIAEDSRRIAGICLRCLRWDLAEEDECEQDHEVPYDF